MAKKWKPSVSGESRKHWVLPAGLLAAAFCGAFFLFGEDAVFVFRWYGAWLLLSFAALPLTMAVFSGFSDYGYIFSKPLGLFLSGGILWACSVFRVLPFRSVTAFVCVGICLALSVLLFHYRTRDASDGAAKFSGTANRITDSWRKWLSGRWENQITWILYMELSFFLLLCYWCYLKGSNAAAYGTEKMMDFGFMMSMDKSPYSPAEDMWFAGEPINYYYVGQFFATFVTKLSGVGVNYGYNLMMMTLPAVGFLECFCIVRQLLASFQGNRQPGWIPVAGGVIAGLADTFAGNMHYVLYALLKLPSDGDYFYPNSTRFIGYNPDVADKTIHEFPSYSFVIGDLHAHVLNYIFVLTVTGLLLSWSLQRKARQETAPVPGQADIEGPDDTRENAAGRSLLERLKELAKDTLGAEIVLVSLFIGIFQGTNYWDFPIYYMVAGAVILFANIRMYRNAARVIQATALQGVAVLGIAWLTGVPFRLHFQMISSHIHPVLHRTAPYQLAILWGLPVLLSIVFLTECFSGFLRKEQRERKEKGRSKEKGRGKERREKEKKEEETRQSAAQKGKWVFQSLSQRILDMRTEDLFMLLLDLCAVGLILIPELVYVEDIYGEAYHRANTMFKLTYQAYILFSLGFGYMLLRLIVFSEKKRQIAWVLAALFTLTLGYFHNAAGAGFGGVFGKGYQTLNGAAFMEEQTQADGVTMLDDAAAVRWINENVTEYPTVILEANADSYTFGGRISTFTGQPTILGWRTHEWLWRSESENPKQYPAAVSERDADISAIYTSGDRDRIAELLQKYDVDYVVIGYQERHNSGIWGSQFDGTLPSEPILKEMGEVVFTSEQNAGEPLYIIRIDR